MNSKFKKIEKKIKKIWNFVGLKILRCARCVHIFVVFGHRRSSWRKKTNFSSKKLWKNALFCFFLSLERLVHHLITKTCKHLVHPSLFDAKKFHIFLNFLAIFLNSLLTAYVLKFFVWHGLLECPNCAKICMRLAPLSIFDPTKFQIFLIFFAIFFWVVKVLWPDGNGAKGHFYKWH